MSPEKWVSWKVKSQYILKGFLLKESGLIPVSFSRVILLFGFNKHHKILTFNSHTFDQALLFLILPINSFYLRSP